MWWKKFFPLNHWNFYLKLVVAVIPALVLGFVFSKKIDELLESPLTVSITMLLGGIILLFIDKLFKAPTVEKEENISLATAFMIGCWQCLAMIPGTSRSAASIIGGMIGATQSGGNHSSNSSSSRGHGGCTCVKK